MYEVESSDGDANLLVDKCMSHRRPSRCLIRKGDYIDILKDCR